MKREQPVSMIGHWVDGPEYEQLLKQAQAFTAACMNHQFMLTEQEQRTLFGITQRINECLWEYGIWPEEDPDPGTEIDVNNPDYSPKLRKLLKSIREDRHVDQE